MSKKFTLEVTLAKDVLTSPDGPISFTLNLNPENKLIRIDENFFERKTLQLIFDKIKDVLAEIEARDAIYHKALDLDHSKLDAAYWSDDTRAGKYNSNFKPSFDRIDRIIYSHESAANALASYARNYNGDVPPRTQLK